MEEKFIAFKYLMNQIEYLRLIKPSSINAVVSENNKMFFVDSEVAGNEIQMKFHEMIEMLNKSNLIKDFMICKPKKIIKLKTVKNKTKHLEHTFAEDVKVIINKNSIHSIHISENNLDAVMMMNIYTHNNDDELIFTFEDKIYNIENFITNNELTMS